MTADWCTIVGKLFLNVWVQGQAASAKGWNQLPREFLLLPVSILSTS
jgi:hypothetical protein